MGTVYAAYKQDPLDDDMQAYDTYAPAPDVNSMSQSPSGMNIYEESRYNYTYDLETSTQWDSPATSTQSYPVPSPATDPASLDIPIGDTESRCGSSSTGSEKRKRKRNTAKPTAFKSTRRAPTKSIKQDAAPEKPKGRGSQAKPASQPTKQSSPQLDDGLDEYRKRIQERNRVASNKFRIKKREDAKRLQADEENMEQTNRKLSSSVSDLTQQVYELKVKLLQHTHCDCYLIQEYIANEANRYICDLGGDKEVVDNCASSSSPFTSLPITFLNKSESRCMTRIRETMTPNPNITIRYDTTMT